MTLGIVFLSEMVGTTILILLGAGVVANNLLPRNKGNGTGWLMVNIGGVVAGLAAGVLLPA